MLKGCVEIFSEEKEQVAAEYGDGEKLILDNYSLADGTYIIVGKSGEVKSYTIKFNKKTKEMEMNPKNTEILSKLRFFDYHSRLVTMDKPVDPKKTIHSNSYLSFWVKKDNLENGKLNQDRINTYFDILVNPKEKYKKPKDRQLYEYIVGKIGEVDKDKVESCRKWIQENIFCLDKYGIDISGKDYLKIFFEEDNELYIKEEQRYVVPKIFNKNDYNVEIDGRIYGLSNDNLALNSKKPYLENKTQKMSIPTLISLEDAMNQRKFFDYLMNQANAGNTSLFFDYEHKKILTKDELKNKEFTGYFLQIKKGTEVGIYHQDVIVNFRYKLRKTFDYDNILEAKDEKEGYKEYKSVDGIEGVIDEVLFSKWLKSNYFTDALDFGKLGLSGELKRNLIESRERIFSWLYKGEHGNIGQVLYKVCMSMVKSSIKNGYISKAQQQFNLLCSFEKYFGGENMADKYTQIRNKLRTKINGKEEYVIESDTEYLYAVGQLIDYYISLSKASKKTHSLANPFFNAMDDRRLKEKLQQYFLKYNYCIEFRSPRFNRLYNMINGYDLEGKVVSQDMIAGYLSSSLIYEKNKENKEEA